jgi:hypothetical protein
LQREILSGSVVKSAPDVARQPARNSQALSGAVAIFDERHAVRERTALDGIAKTLENGEGDESVARKISSLKRHVSIETSRYIKDSVELSLVEHHDVPACSFHPADSGKAKFFDRTGESQDAYVVSASLIHKSFAALNSSGISGDSPISATRSLSYDPSPWSSASLPSA